MAFENRTVVSPQEAADRAVQSALAHVRLDGLDVEDPRSLEGARVAITMQRELARRPPGGISR